MLSLGLLDLWFVWVLQHGFGGFAVGGRFVMGGLLWVVQWIFRCTVIRIVVALIFADFIFYFFFVLQFDYFWWICCWSVVMGVAWICSVADCVEK